jgi:tetratricopeptide (TPR) repeat protein
MRPRFWIAVGITALSLLTMTTVLVVVQFRQIEQLRRELETLKAESVRYGQGVEIFNPAWGTVIDAVDPQRLPSRDGRDPRYGAVVQQYTPRGNPAQTWQLRPPSGRPEQDPPLAADAYVRHGLSFLSARDLARATLAFETCLKYYPDNPGAHNGLGIVLRDKGDFAQSLAHHDRAVEAAPNTPSHLWERAVTLLRKGEMDKAIKDCQSALEQDPAFANAHNTLGIIYRNQRNYAEALKHHDRAVESDPTREDIWRERSVTHQANGDQAKAAADAARARELQQTRR